MMRRSSRRSAQRALLRAMHAKWSERRSACTRRGGASSTPSVNSRDENPGHQKAASGRLFSFRKANPMIKAGIVGGTGYTGIELLRLLAQHPQVELAAITSRQETGRAVSDLYPSLRGRVSLAFTHPDKAPLAKCDVVFFATPNGVAMGEARA